NCVLSCLWPSVITTASGRPLPSPARCSLVVRPPRLRPSASPASGSAPFFGRLPTGSGRVLVGAHRGAIDIDPRPVQVTGGVCGGQQGFQHLAPDPAAFPAGEP